MTPLTHRIAVVLGPAIVAVTVSETINLDIWASVHPTLVYLNGLVFLIAGLVIVTTHNIWRSWTAGTVTATGWLLLLLGAVRMAFPSAPQLDASPLAYTAIACFCLLGVRLCMIGFLTKTP